MSIDTEFIPKANERVSFREAEQMVRGPLCECGSAECMGQELPKPAWVLVGTVGQWVVLPGHQRSEVEVYEMDGFVIEKMQPDD